MQQSEAVVTVHADRGEPWLAYVNPLVALQTVWSGRELLWQLTRREVVGRYRGSLLGIFWALLTPLLTLAVFTLVFGTMNQHRWSNSSGGGILNYATNLFIGIVLYSVFSEVAVASGRLVTGNPNFVKKAVFPLEMLSISALLTAVVHGALALVIQFIAVYLALGYVPVTAVALPLLFIPLALFTLGISWMLAALGVFFRDLPNLVGPLVQLLFFLTPIVYDRSMLNDFSGGREGTGDHQSVRGHCGFGTGSGDPRRVAGMGTPGARDGVRSVRGGNWIHTVHALTQVFCRCDVRCNQVRLRPYRRRSNPMGCRRIGPCTCRGWGRCTSCSTAPWIA